MAGASISLLSLALTLLIFYGMSQQYKMCLFGGKVYSLSFLSVLLAYLTLSLSLSLCLFHPPASSHWPSLAPRESPRPGEEVRPSLLVCIRHIEAH